MRSEHSEPGKSGEALIGMAEGKPETRDQKDNLTQLPQVCSFKNLDQKSVDATARSLVGGRLCSRRFHAQDTVEPAGHT